MITSIQILNQKKSRISLLNSFLSIQMFNSQKVIKIEIEQEKKLKSERIFQNFPLKILKITFLTPRSFK